MNSKIILKNLGGLGEFNALDNYGDTKKFAILRIDSFNYGLLIYAVRAYRISFIRLCLKELICNIEDDVLLNIGDSNFDKKAYEISFLNVFCLPFPLFTIVCTSKNVWAIGQGGILDLKPYIEKAIEKVNADENDDNMDIVGAMEFRHDMFDIAIKVQVEKCDLHLDDIFIGCNFIDCGVIWCHKKLSTWNLELLLSNDRSAGSSDVMILSFLDFPVSFYKNRLNVVHDPGQPDIFKPHVVFIHYNDPESHMFRNLFGINCASPNVICLIGHPEGKLFWSLCDSSNQFYSSLKLQTIFDMKQPIVGIFLVKDVEAFEDCDFMLIVGALGQITLISSKKYPTFTLEPGNHPFWTVTVHLKSSITNCIVIKDCLLHFSSDGVLWILNLSTLLSSYQTAGELSSPSNSSEFCCIQQMTIVDENQGLILLKTSYGNMYLTQLIKEVDIETVTSSLPSLMNDCLKQSNEMQELLNKKVLQSRLFATISTFASLKFCSNILNEPITFSITEVNLEPRRYMLVINLKCLEKLRLDCELCHVTATVFTYFKDNNCSITKTAPYNADEPTLCLELIDTVLQPLCVSIFPLFVEVGLILQLPNSWRVLDCFQTVLNWFPYYLRIETFMVHELNLFQSTAIFPPQSLRCEVPRIVKIIKELALKRPISNILQVEPQRNYHIPKKFNICLSASTVNDMMGNTSESDPCKYIEKLLFGNMNSEVKESYLAAKGCPISLNVVKSNNHIVITINANSFDSLIGLRIAVMDILLSAHNKSKHFTSSSSYVNIPASIYRKCESISKSLLALFGKDIDSDEVTQSLMQLYQELRTEVSGKLPIL